MAPQDGLTLGAIESLVTESANLATQRHVVTRKNENVDREGGGGGGGEKKKTTSFYMGESSGSHN